MVRKFIVDAKVALKQSRENVTKANSVAELKVEMLKMIELGEMLLEVAE